MSASSDAFCLGNQFFWCIVVKNKPIQISFISACPNWRSFEFTQCISMGQMGCDFSSLTNWSGVFRIYLISKYVCGARRCYGVSVRFCALNIHKSHTRSISQSLSRPFMTRHTTTKQQRISVWCLKRKNYLYGRKLIYVKYWKIKTCPNVLLLRGNFGNRRTDIYIYCVFV